MSADKVILASGSRPLQTLSRDIASLNIPFKVIGDCIKPGKINDAVHAGFLAATGIDGSLSFMEICPVS